jgi:hypothetical protein
MGFREWGNHLLMRWAHPNHLAIRCIVPLLDNNRLGVNTLLPFAMANGGLFIVGEFIPHDSSLPRGSSNNDPAARLNSDRLSPSEAKS